MGDGSEKGLEKLAGVVTWSHTAGASGHLDTQRLRGPNRKWRVEARGWDKSCPVRYPVAGQL